MAVKSTADLATAVLNKLCIIDATETSADYPEAETLIISAYTDKFAELQDRDLTYDDWSETAIPQPIFLAVRDLVTNEVRETFGEPMSQQAMMQEEEVTIRRIRRHIQRPAWQGSERVRDY